MRSDLKRTRKPNYHPAAQTLSQPWPTWSAKRRRKMRRRCTRTASTNAEPTAADMWCKVNTEVTPETPLNTDSEPTTTDVKYDENEEDETARTSEDKEARMDATSVVETKTRN